MKSLPWKWMVVSVAAPLTWAAGAVLAEEVGKEPVAKPGGRLQVAAEVVDVGDIVRGQEAKGTFLLKNVGDQTLKVLSAKPG